MSKAPRLLCGEFRSQVHFVLFDGPTLAAFAHAARSPEAQKFLQEEPFGYRNAPPALAPSQAAAAAPPAATESDAQADGGAGHPQAPAAADIAAAPASGGGAQAPAEPLQVAHHDAHAHAAYDPPIGMDPVIQ